MTLEANVKYKPNAIRPALSPLIKIATTRIPATTKALITIAQNLITFKALTDTSEHVLFLLISSHSLYALI